LQQHESQARLAWAADIEKLILLNAHVIACHVQGDLNDLVYAERYIRGQWRAKKLGPSALLRALTQQRGIDKQLAERAVASFFGSTGTSVTPVGQASDEAISPHPSSTNQSLGTHSLGADSHGQLHVELIAAAGAKLSTMHGVPEDAQKRRLVSWLMRRGHPWQPTCTMVLKELGLF
jgi:SOS response regulatory protein OraA/RecX